MSDAVTRRTQPAARRMGQRRATAIALRLGEQVHEARRRRRWSQATLGARIGVSQAHQSQIECRLGAGVPLAIWFALAEALEIPLRVEFVRDRLEEPADAGPLKLQELVMRQARRAGFGATFELPTKPADRSRSVDVCLRDDRSRHLVLVECWNTFGNIGSAVRVTKRKLVDVQALAVSVGGPGGAYSVSACWVVRDTGRNREIIARYPEIFAATFIGSSAHWVQALAVSGAPVPAGLGLVWSDTAATKLVRWRRQTRSPEL